MYKTGVTTNPWIDTGYDATYDEWKQLLIHWRTAPSAAGANDGLFDLYYDGVKILDGGFHPTWTNGTLNWSRNVPHAGAPGYEFYMDNYVSGKLLEGEHLPLGYLLGDADGNGVVSADDFASVQSTFGNSGAPGIPGDADYNGVVSADDFASIQANFGNHLPEPATLGLMLLGGLTLLRRRR